MQPAQSSSAGGEPPRDCSGRGAEARRGRTALLLLPESGSERLRCRCVLTHSVRKRSRGAASGDVGRRVGVFSGAYYGRLRARRGEGGDEVELEDLAGGLPAHARAWRSRASRVTAGGCAHDPQPRRDHPGCLNELRNACGTAVRRRKTVSLSVFRSHPSSIDRGGFRQIDPLPMTIREAYGRGDELVTPRHSACSRPFSSSRCQPT
jgi:hypothetical protein